MKFIIHDVFKPCNSALLQLCPAMPMADFSQETTFTTPVAICTEALAMCPLTTTAICKSWVSKDNFLMMKLLNNR